MSSVYEAPAWSKNDKQFKKVIDTLKGPMVGFHQAVTWLRQRKDKDEDFDLTNFWAAMTGAMIMKTMDWNLLSVQANRNSTNPYPIYSTIERYIHQAEQKRKGFCGSAIADAETNKQELKKMLKWIFGSLKSGGQYFVTGQNGPFVSLETTIDCDCAPTKIMNCLSDLLEFTMDPEALMQQEEEVLELIKKLESLLDGHLDSDGNMLWSMDLKQWQKSSLKEREEVILSVCQELIHTSENWPSSFDTQTCHCYGGAVTYLGSGREMVVFPSAENGGEQSNILANRNSENSWTSTIKDIWWVMKNISPLLYNWTWGTTSNFLYRFQDPDIPPKLASKQEIFLIDAGLMINSPYPPVLRPEREVDLIISLDFSAGDPFETVFLASDYADELNLAFPELDPEVRKDEDKPKDCYVFPGQPREPTVIHMPLFNLQNCKDEEDIHNEREKFKTEQLPYSTEKITELLEKAQKNMKNNKDRLLDEIMKAVRRKRNLFSSSKVAPPRVPLIANKVLMQSKTRGQEPITAIPVRNQEPSPSMASSANQQPPGSRMLQSNTSGQGTVPANPVRNQEPSPGTATSASQGPPGYYLMPVGYAPFPSGPLPYWPLSIPPGQFMMPYWPFSTQPGPYVNSERMHWPLRNPGPSPPMYIPCIPFPGVFPPTPCHGPVIPHFPGNDQE